MNAPILAPIAVTDELITALYYALPRVGMHHANYRELKALHLQLLMRKRDAERVQASNAELDAQDQHGRRA